MNHLILYSARNMEGKRDGDEFTREARAYARFHAERGDTCSSMAIPLHLPAWRRTVAVEKAMADARAELGRPFDVLALFCHGTERWLQTGHALAKLPGLAEVLAGVLSPSPVLWFAACRAAGGNPRPARKGEISRGGILQQLVLRLFSHGLTATGWGHTTAGHTTRNPNLALVTATETVRVTPAQRFALQKELWSESDLRFRIPLAESIPALLEMIKKA